MIPVSEAAAVKRTRLLRCWGMATLLALALAGQVPLARAAIVDTDALGAQSQAALDRAKVQAFVDRADVNALAQHIDALPAGGNLSEQDIIIILLIAILVAIVL